MAMAQTEEGVGDITSISPGSKQTGDSIVPAQAQHQGVAVSSSVSDPSTTTVSHVLSPARDPINGSTTHQVTKQDDANNRVQVLCRFRCPAKTYGQKSCMTARGAFDELGNGSSWLQFGDSREEEDNRVSGGAGGTRRALETVSIRIGYEWSRRAFDRVFRPDASQAEVYEELEHVAHGVGQGFNGTIFAYGQTGSGKTYTMGGAETTLAWTPTSGVPGVATDDLDNADPVHDAVQDATPVEALPEEAGVIPRAVSTVLADAHARREQGWEFVLSATYVEIYNERIRDLLNPANDNLKVSEHPARGIEAVGATEVRVYSLEEAVEVLRNGARYRMTAPTLMNQVSSRSHTIFTLRLDQRDVVRDCMVSGRLTLVDLAGSERAGKSRAEGKRLEEANSINVSLHTLGRVIRALSLSTSHVPFRDSKLTRLLQESLGGNSRTVLIVCCSPEETQAQETLSTLKFGECAKRVSTFASANVVAAPNEVAAQLSELRAEVVRLKRHLYNYQLREARRYEATAQAPRRSKHPRRAIRGGYSPQDGVTISPNAVNYAAGVGDPMTRRWGAGSPFDRTVSLNASSNAGDVDGSSGDEYWTGPAPREWDQNDPNGWVDDGDEVDEPSPSGTTQGWMAVVDGQSPSAGSPTNSAGATPDSREDPNGGSGDRKNGADNRNRRRYRRGDDRRLWTETPDYGGAQRRRAGRLATSATNGAVVIDEDCSTPNTGRTGSSGDASADYRRSPWNPGRQDGSQEGSREGSAEGSWEAEGSDPVYREEDERQEGIVQRPTQAYKHAVPQPSTQARIAARSASGLREEFEGGNGARARGKQVADSAANGGPQAGIEDLDQVGTNGDAVVMLSSTCEDDASEEVLCMHLALARLEKLEKGWKERIAEYEKLLQLKELRIQSLMSVYRSGSSELREAVNEKLGGASATPPEVAPASTVGTERAPLGARKATSRESEQHRLVGHSIHGGGEDDEDGDEDGDKRATRRIRRTAVSKRSPSATDRPVASKLEDGNPPSPPPPPSPSREQDRVIDTRVVHTSTGGR